MIWSDREVKEKKRRMPQGHALSFSAKFARQISITACEYPVKTLADCSAKHKKL